MVILSYPALTLPASRGGGMQTLLAVGTFWVISLLWVLWVWRSRQSYGYRRLAGLLFDIAGVTLAFVLAGKLSVFFYPIYQWIIIGHGLRYGKQIMIVATVLTVSGFGIAISITPYWQQNLLAASGLMVGLVILPVYLFVLTHKLHELNARLKTELFRTYHAATHDLLTGINNRQYFYTQLADLIRDADQSGQSLAVLFIDLDEFKVINDKLSHSAGDEVLQIIAERLRRNCRDQDVTARLGGDEFAMVITDTKGHEIEGTLQRIMESIREPISINDQLHYLSGSIGISIFPHDGHTPDKLVHNADVAMYEAKRIGKNAYVYFSRVSAV